MFESERIARKMFSLSAKGDQPALLDYLHPEAEVFSALDAEKRIEGKDVPEDYDSFGTPKVIRADASRFIALDEARVIVEGRIRVRKPNGQISDGPLTWALVYREGLLYRSYAARDVSEAEELLAPYASEAMTDP